MPTYEYACRTCAEHLEVVQSFKDDPLTICPNCGGELRKVFGAIGIAFKGSGFYRNDSRPQDSGEAAKERSEAKGESGKSEKGAEPAGAKSGSGSSGSSGTGGSDTGGSDTGSRARTSQSDRTSAASP